MDILSEGAILCYWIVRLHPFHREELESSELNARIAIYIFIQTIYSYLNKTEGNYKILSDDFFINELYNTLKHKELNEESLIPLAKSFHI